MDTVSVTIKFDRMLEVDEIEKIESYRFIKVSRGKREFDKSIFKISYPKFVGENNATLITNKEDVLKCNKRFVEILKEIRPNDTMTLNINRIDIPVTYIMPENKTFTQYKSMFYLLAKIYKKRVRKECGTKGILDLKESKFQTIVYADSKNVNDYNCKVVFYDQYARYKDTYKGDTEELVKKHPDLKRRMRIEVSKKINRKPMELEEFSNFDLLGKYNEDFMRYILDNLFDLNLLWNEIEEQKRKWKVWFDAKIPNFIGKMLWEVIKKEDMYEPMRNAMNELKLEKKNYEARITILRKMLKRIEDKDNIMIIDLYNEVLKIRCAIAMMLTYYK
ncbi:MAG: hypothetical protein RR523_06435 [Cetobacterium sp.]|uniref:hypothetical protein n=1 Tax=Cetobacterium sp. TaxID=2071632 RepID=UPI002FC8D50A